MKILRMIWIALGVSLVALLLGLFVVGARLESLLDRVEPVPMPTVSAAGSDLHFASFVADLHADSLLFGRDLLVRSDVGHVDLPRLQEGGVGLQVFTAVTKAPYPLALDGNDAGGFDLLTLGGLIRFDRLGLQDPFGRALLQAHRLARFAVRSDGQLRLIRDRADLESLLVAHRGDRRIVGALYGLEGAHALEGRLENLAPLFDAGVRLIGLAHFFDNAFVGSAHGVNKQGLSAKGRELVAFMQERGIVIDLAHVSERGIDDVLAVIDRPPIVSHTGVRATCDNQRNLSDRQIRAIAVRGGVIGIGYFDWAICGRRPADVLAAMRHVIELVGDDYVALGSDYDGATTVGFDTSRLPALTQAMLNAGFSPQTVRKLLGENVLRVLRAVLSA